MKKVLIVSEKPYVSRAIAQILFSNPHIDLNACHVRFVHTNYIGAFEFAYPVDMRWNNYPFVSEPVFKERSTQSYYPQPLEVVGKHLERIDMLPTELFVWADTIINACDPDHTGAEAFYRIVTQLIKISADKYDQIILVSLEKSRLKEAIANRSIFSMKPIENADLAYGLCKRYFEWNFNINSLGIFGKTQQRAGIDGQPLFFSKYMVQVMLWLAEEGKAGTVLSFSDVINQMQHWQGTGKYSFNISLGSAASFDLIRSNLVVNGFLQDMSPLLTDKAQRLIQSIHPDCRDLDLPFRLHNWCSDPDKSKTSIDSYIKRFFGKQKKYLEKIQ